MRYKNITANALTGIFGVAIALPAFAANEVAELRAMIEQMQARLAQLEKSGSSPSTNRGTGDSTGAPVTRGDIPGSFKLPGSDTSLKVYGHATAHATYDFKARANYAAVGWGGTLLAQPLNGTAAGERHGESFATARGSRFGFISSTPTEALGTITTKVEGDFDGSDSTVGGETMSHVRLREGYVQFGNYLIGQTYSTFTDLSAMPALVEWNGTGIAPTIRQAMVRYSVPLGQNRIDLAVENSQGRRGRDVDESFDVIARFDRKTSWGHFSVRAVALNYNSDAGNKWGTGVAGSARINLSPADSFVIYAAGGNGIGRYMFNGVIQGAADTATGIELWKAAGAHVGYTHRWSDSLMTTLAYAYTRFDENREALAASAGPTSDFTPNETLRQGWLSMIYNPYKKLDIGLDLTVGERKTFTGAKGELTRLTGLLRYRFD